MICLLSCMLQPIKLCHCTSQRLALLRTQIEGRVKAGWVRGNKKISLAGGSTIDLPPFTVRAATALPPSRAWCSGGSSTR